MRVTHIPEALGDPPIPNEKKKRLAVQRRTSLSHGGELSGAKGHCRILRSSSANTASTIPESKIKKQIARTNPATCQLVPSLSRGLSGSSGAPRRRASGPIAPTSSCRGSESQNGSQHHTKHIRRHIKETPYRSTILSHSDARVVSPQARQSATMGTEHLRHEPTIMDIFLDLQSAVLDDDDAPHMEGYHRSRIRFPGYREYTFTDEQSLVIYWADQAAIWGGTRVIDPEASTTRFPDSDERSTASWDPSLNGSQVNREIDSAGHRLPVT